MNFRVARNHLRRQKVRWRIGQKNRVTRLIGGFRPRDTILSSYPRSGNTWMRFLVANLMDGTREVSSDQLDQIVPGVFKLDRQGFEELPEPRVYKMHHPLFRDFPRFVYIVRHPLDSLWSYYHFQVGTGIYAGTAADFLRYKDVAWEWADHAQSAYAQLQTRPAEVCWVRYEDLKSNTHGELTRVADFLNLDVTSDQIATSVERCRIDNLRKNERKHGSVESKQGLDFFRSGEVGQGDKSFDAESIRYIRRLVGPTAAKLGYDMNRS
ncbi:MAG: sulfotransferase domain-containing protein [Planctomycetota bacterium]